MTGFRSVDFDPRYLLCMAFLHGASFSAAAQTPATIRPGICTRAPDIPANYKLEFRATNVVDDAARLHLSGRVNLAFKGYCLLADSLELDRARSTLTANGNVELFEPNGNIIRAERLTLSDEFRDAFRDAVATSAP